MLFRSFARADLVAEQFERRGGGADEPDTGLAQRICEARILREETVTRMHGVAIVFAGGRDHRVDVEIRGNASTCERVRIVGACHVQTARIVRRVDRGGRDAEFFGSADDADGDFAAIGDEDAAYAHD